MADFICTGLYGSHPLGALAALGMLRVASRLPLPQPVRLSWVVQPDWVARLHVPGAVSQDAVVQAFVADVAERATAPELMWRQDLKATPDATTSMRLNRWPGPAQRTAVRSIFWRRMARK